MSETAYATASDLLAALDSETLSQLSSDVGETTADGDAVIAQVLVDASRDIDAYLGSRYALPISSADSLAILRPKCVDIAKFKLMERRFASKYDPACSEAKNNAISWLKQVSKKDASLYGSTDAAVPTTVSTAVSSSVGSDVAIFLDPNDPDTGVGLL